MPITAEKLKELITCSLCLETFENPKALKCLHTFCQVCLDDIVKLSRDSGQQGFRCPSCRKFTIQNDVSSNFHTVQLIDLYATANQPQSCTHCKQKESTWKCKDCVDFFCDECKDGHLRVRALSKHQMVPIDEANTYLAVNKPLECQNHPGEILKYNCKECQTMLCTACAIIDHEGHKRETIDDSVKSYTEKVFDLTEKLKQRLNRRMERKAQVQICEEQIKSSVKEVNKQTHKNKSKVTESEDQAYKHALQVANDNETRIITEAEKEYERAMLAAKQRKDRTIAKAKGETKEAYSIAKQKHATRIKEIDTDFQSINERLDKVSKGELQKTSSFIKEVSGDINEITGLIGYAENTLATAEGGPLLRELQDHILPILHEAASCKKDSLEIPPLVRPYLKKDGSTLGSVSTRWISQQCNCRLQDVDFEKLFGEKIKPVQTIDINLENMVYGYRISLGFNKIVVCFYIIESIIVFDIHGKQLKTISLRGHTKQAPSAVFINDNSLCVAQNGLFLLDFDSEEIKHVTNGQFADICYCNDAVYALSYDDGSILVKTANEWSKDGHKIETGLGKVSPFSTCVATESSIYICDNIGSIHEFALNGKKLNTLKVDVNYPKICVVNKASEALVAGDASKVCVISATKPLTEHRVYGTTCLKDVAFQDSNTFWMFDRISLPKGQYKLIKYAAE